MNIKEACEETGFEMCDFPPDENECDKCNMPNRQLLYRRTDYFAEEGQYFCANCVIDEADSNKELEEFWKSQCSCCGQCQAIPCPGVMTGGLCDDMCSCEGYYEQEY